MSVSKDDKRLWQFKELLACTYTFLYVKFWFLKKRGWRSDANLHIQNIYDFLSFYFVGSDFNYFYFIFIACNWIFLTLLFLFFSLVDYFHHFIFHIHYYYLKKISHVFSHFSHHNFHSEQNNITLKKKSHTFSHNLHHCLNS